MHVESLGKAVIQQAFLEPCLVNLISKDPHLYSISFAREETCLILTTILPYIGMVIIFQHVTAMMLDLKEEIVIR